LNTFVPSSECLKILFEILVIGAAGESSSLKVKGQKVPTKPKSDAVLPAYCNPPNPCPVGHTADDGCLEIFENTAAFSRAYQGSQDCMCDTEHMFDCHASQESEESDLGMGQSQFLSELQVIKCIINNGQLLRNYGFFIILLIFKQVDGQHKSLVAKKFYNKKVSF